MSNKTTGKIVKQIKHEDRPASGQRNSRQDPFHNAPALEVEKGRIQAKLVCFPAPPPITTNARLLNQAIYYVANDRPKDARKCLLAQEPPFTSFQAKCWVKEEQAVQRRHPEERDRYHGLAMPEEFQVDWN